MKDTMFRRVIASALALALCASASVPAFADSEAADDSTLGTQATADDSATGDGAPLPRRVPIRSVRLLILTM